MSDAAIPFSLVQQLERKSRRTMWRRIAAGQYRVGLTGRRLANGKGELGVLASSLSPAARKELAGRGAGLPVEHAEAARPEAATEAPESEKADAPEEAAGDKTAG